MARKPKPKPDDPEEYKRFLETAKDVEASDSQASFDRAFKRVVRLSPDKRPKSCGSK